MTKYTAEDFARAEFARHKDGRVAARTEPHDTASWEDRARRYTDAGMADAGWSIVRDAGSMTPREHLDAMWEKAYAPEDGKIPARAACIVRYDDGVSYAYSEGYEYYQDAKGVGIERRLLDPPAPAWHRAQIIRARRDDDHDSGRWARMDSGRWVCLDGESAGIECAPVDLRDVTVIVGAEK